MEKPNKKGMHTAAAQRAQTAKKLFSNQQLHGKTWTFLGKLFKISEPIFHDTDLPQNSILSNKNKIKKYLYQNNKMWKITHFWTSRIPLNI